MHGEGVDGAIDRSDQPGTTGTPSEWRVWLDGTRVWALRLLRSPWLFVLLAAVGPLYWGRPFGDLLYGQDSTRLFQPFSFNDSPMIPYSYLDSSTFPVPDFTPNFYIDSTLQLFADLSIPPWLSERLLLSLFAGLAAGGAVVLLRSIDSVRDRPVATRGYLLGLVALVYVYNPFTLSIAFWHVEGWTLFLAFLPWLVALAIRSAHGHALPVRFAIAVTLLGVYLAPGAISSFAVPVALVVVWGIAAVWLTDLRRPVRWWNRLSRSVLLLGAALGIEAWSFLPFLLIPNIAYTSTNYVTPANLVFVYQEVSATATPYSVVTLTAFSWLVQTPSAYGWIAWFPILAAAAVVFPLLAILGARGLRRSPGALLVYAIGLTALPLMVGGVVPLSNLDLALLRVGGPFLVLAGAYYVLGTVYLLVPIVGLHEVVRRDAASRPTPGPGPPPDCPSSAWRRAGRVVRRPSTLVTVALAVLLVLCALPFALGDVDQTQGPNANVVPLPPSYPALEKYFGSPANGPDYYVLVLPMSAQNGAYLDIAGRQYLDTGNLLASFIPYPVLETNNGPTAAALEDLFASGPPVNLGAVLANAHVRYVIDNAFANRSAPSMNRAPDGEAVNYSAIVAALPNATGAATTVGRFAVFAVPGAVPIGWSTSQLVGVDTPDDDTALGFVGAVSSGPSNWVPALRGALWAPNGTLPGWQLRPTPVTAPSATIAVPPGFQPGVVDRAGHWSAPPCSTGSCIANGTVFGWSGSELTVRGPVERNSSMPGAFRTAQPSSPQGYCSTPAQPVYLASNGSVSGPAVLSANVTLVGPAANNWATIELTDGNVQLLLQTYEDTTGPSSALALSASTADVPFAWHNALLPHLLPAGVAWTMSLWWNASTASATLSAGTASVSTELAFGDRTADAINPGFNSTAVPPGVVRLTNANETVSLVGGALCLHSTEVAELPNASFLVAEGPGSPESASGASASSVTASGDVLVSSATARYVVLGFPYDPLWTASGGNGVGVTEVEGAPFANVYAVTGGENWTVVTLHFRTWIIVGLEASWVEVGALLAVFVVLTVRRSGRWGGAPRLRPPNTPGAPIPVEPQGPPR